MKKNIRTLSMNVFVYVIVSICSSIVIAENSSLLINGNKSLFLIDFMDSYDDIDPPTIMVTFTWSFQNIGDIGITPGIIELIKNYIPGAKIILVANSYSEEMAEYY